MNRGSPISLPQVTSFVDGAYLPVAGDPMEVIGPADGVPVALLYPAEPDEVIAAVGSARRAFDAGHWRGAHLATRQAALCSVADRMEQDLELLATLETRCNGLPIVQAKVMVQRAAATFRFFAEFAGQNAEQLYRQEQGYITMVAREPCGVAALISPWNAPLLLASMKIAGAIAFGNACVLKPSEQTPLSLQHLMTIIGEAGVPAGVVNMVNGTGAVTGRALVEADGVDVISFTGGTETGRSVMAAGAARIRPVATELGGKSANIIFADADLARALDGALFSAFFNNGQACLAGSRILVQRKIADQFIADFIARSRAIRVGDPMQADTELGPVISAAHRQRILNFLDGAQSGGCTVLTGGSNAGRDRGFYLDPIAVLAPHNRLRVCQDEIFGPFATFLTFDTPEEAFAIANDNAFGLASYVWTKDLSLALASMRALRAGTTWINTPLMRDLRAGFGGFGDSGIGRESGRGSMEMFTQEKATIIGDGTTPIFRLGAAA